ncbi:MAG TPA: nucleotidyltransferase domain-containing protein [Candidatus Deferrimicrobium sp.]|nr:nucleotidyltransferase domain-containing protein [Candidatus Deferrimicrobium sp.]
METPKNIFELFKDLIQKIQQKIKLHAVILFGSRAKGDAKFYSDFDLVIIGDFKIPFFERIKWVLWETPSVPVDVFCYTPEEFDKMFNSYHLTAIDAIGEGLVLFGQDFVQPYKIKYQEFVQHGMRKTECTLIPPSL